MNRGEIWWAQVGRKERPVLVLTRQAVIDVRELVTVAEITSQARGLAVEVPLLGEDETGLDQPSVINADGIHTLRQTVLSTKAGHVSDRTLRRACEAVARALGC